MFSKNSSSFFLPSFKLPNPHFSFVQDIFSRISSGYDLMNILMSFGLDHHWRKKGAQFIPWFSFYKEGRKHFSLGDGACGTGDMFGALLPFLLELQKDHGSLKNFFSFMLVDPNVSMLDLCEKKMTSWFLPQDINLRGFFHHRDILRGIQEILSLYYAPDLSLITKEESYHLLKSITYYDWALENMALLPNSLDLFTLCFGLRNVENNKRFEAIERVFYGLKPKGWFFIMEFLPPQNTPFPEIYREYLKILPFLGKWVLQDSKAYDYLAQSIHHFPSPQEIEMLLRACGFSSVESTSLFPGVLHIYRAQK